MPCINQITNGAPLVLFRGTEDQSEKVVPIESIPRPQHLPIFIIQAKRGPTTPQITLGGTRTLMYGADTFAENGLWTNHQTIGSNIASSAGNSHIIWRVSNGTQATLRLSLEVTPIDVPLYQRDTLGKYLIDGTTGALIPEVGDPTTPGNMLRWVVSDIPDDVGAGSTSTYTQAGQANDTTVYPIMDFKVADPGAFGNNVGVRIYADTSTGGVDAVGMVANKAFPYRFSLLERPSTTEAPKYVPTISGDRVSVVSFSPNAITRPSIPTSIYLKSILDTKYENTTDTRYPLTYSPVGSNTFVYTANVTAIVEMIGVFESDYLTANPTVVTGLDTTLLTSTDGYGILNLMSAKDHSNIPYYTIVMDEAELPGSSIRLTQYTTVYARGGADNIMSLTEYEAAVTAIMARYADCTDEVQDIARRPESIFWDTGFTLNTKLTLADFITQRPDLNLVLSTHEDSTQVRGYTGADPVGESVKIDMSTEVATATILQNMVRLVPESEFYGTPTSRAIIWAGSCLMRNSMWTNRVPVTMDMLYKACRYMGAANGQWNPTYRFSRAPGNILTTVYDVTIPWVPAQTRVVNWDAGINMALAYNEQFMAMPSAQTVYPNDTSVLNNWLVTLAISYINKIAHAAWREFRGVDDLSNSELEVALNNFVQQRIANLWDGRYIVIPEAQVTVDDDLRGTSWHLNVKFGASTARTVEIFRVTAYRKSDLVTTA